MVSTGGGASTLLTRGRRAEARPVRGRAPGVALSTLATVRTEPGVRPPRRRARRRAEAGGRRSAHGEPREVGGAQGGCPAPWLAALRGQADPRPVGSGPRRPRSPSPRAAPRGRVRGARPRPFGCLAGPVDSAPCPKGGPALGGMWDLTMRLRRIRLQARAAFFSSPGLSVPSPARRPRGPSRTPRGSASLRPTPPTASSSPLPGKGMASFNVPTHLSLGVPSSSAGDEYVSSRSSTATRRAAGGTSRAAPPPTYQLYTDANRDGNGMQLVTSR